MKTLTPVSKSVNAQVTDAVTQSNVQVVAEAPALATGMLYQMATQASGLSMQNAVQSQQSMNQISTAVVSASVTTIMSLAELTASTTKKKTV